MQLANLMRIIYNNNNNKYRATIMRTAMLTASPRLFGLNTKLAAAFSAKLLPLNDLILAGSISSIQIFVLLLVLVHSATRLYRRRRGGMRLNCFSYLVWSYLSNSKD